jgi:hypothetical protein
MRRSSAIAYATAAFLPAMLFVLVPFSSGDSFAMLALLTVAAAWLASALYVVFALRSPTVPREKRGLWIAVIVLGNIVALPFFWFWYVRQPNNATST